MDAEKIDRIKALAKKAKATGLTPEEAEEQQQLRSEYVAAFRHSLQSTLDNAYQLDSEGRQVKIRKKKEPLS